jgi:hypothetical protein
MYPISPHPSRCKRDVISALHTRGYQSKHFRTQAVQCLIYMLGVVFVYIFFYIILYYYSKFVYVIILKSVNIMHIKKKKYDSLLM